jgi:hypothetical protein
MTNGKLRQKYPKFEMEVPTVARFTGLAHLAAARQMKGTPRDIGYHRMTAGGVTHPAGTVFTTIHMKKKEHGKLYANKMDDMISINTSPLKNEFCMKMHTKGKEMFKAGHKNPIICGRCYSITDMKLRPNVAVRYAENLRLLSESIMPFEVLPRFAPGEVVRFHANGELRNETHLKNFINIAMINPHASFVLWTKRLDLVRGLRNKPANLRMIYSNPVVDKPLLKPPLPVFDGVFNVIDKCDMTSNCAGQCKVCKRCYGERPPGTIIEHIKV